MAFSASTREFHVRIPVAELPRLDIQHYVSALDPSIAVPDSLTATSGELLTGYTEWVGSWEGAQVSVGWDWACVRGDIIALDPSEIRTNIQLITADGSAESPLLTRMYLYDWLETLPWRDGPVRDLAAGRGPQADQGS
jgi:hypothetical protein